MLDLQEAWLDGEDVYWCEGRPKEQRPFCGGKVWPPRAGRRCDTSSRSTSAPECMSTAEQQCWSRSGTVYFANFADQKLYRQTVGGWPHVISRTAQCRYADAAFDGARRRLILVREDHRVSDSQPTNTIAAVAIDGSSEVVLVEGNDFYSNPRLSPDGSRLAWLTWNHPHMPWVSTELWVGELDDAGHIVGQRQIAGSPAESLFQPEWSPEGIAALHLRPHRMVEPLPGKLWSD